MHAKLYRSIGFTNTPADTPSETETSDRPQRRTREPGIDGERPRHAHARGPRRHAKLGERRPRVRSPVLQNWLDARGTPDIDRRASRVRARPRSRPSQERGTRADPRVRARAQGKVMNKPDGTITDQSLIMPDSTRNPSSSQTVPQPRFGAGIRGEIRCRLGQPKPRGFGGLGRSQPRIHGLSVPSSHTEALIDGLQCPMYGPAGNGGAA